jgi:hypothetical protein
MFTWAFGPLVISLVTCRRQIHSLLDPTTINHKGSCSEANSVWLGCAVQRGRRELPCLACQVHLILS